MKLGRLEGLVSRTEDIILLDLFSINIFGEEYKL
jgi:hypothetical protein